MVQNEFIIYLIKATIKFDTYRRIDNCCQCDKERLVQKLLKFILCQFKIFVLHCEKNEKNKGESIGLSACIRRWHRYTRHIAGRRRRFEGAAVGVSRSVGTARQRVWQVSVAQPLSSDFLTCSRATVLFFNVSLPLGPIAAFASQRENHYVTLRTTRSKGHR